MEFLTIIGVYLAFVYIGKWVALREINNPTGNKITSWFAEKYKDSPF